jgi:hypothetical protein
VFLSIEERVFRVEHFFREGNTCKYAYLVQDPFAETSQKHPVPYRNALRRLIGKFSEICLGLEVERSGRPSKLNDKKLREISDSMLRSASKSLGNLAQQKYIGLATTHKAVMEKLNLFPYKITAVKELKPADHGK